MNETHFICVCCSTSQPPNILFSYKAQVDESLDEDTVSMPQQIYTSVKPDGTEQQVMSGSYDSTHFDGPSPNPLYNNSDMVAPINAELAMAVDFYGSSPEHGQNGKISYA